MAHCSVNALQLSDLDDARLLDGLGSCPRGARRDWAALVSDEAPRALMARDGGGRACGLLVFSIVSRGPLSPCVRVDRLIAFDPVAPRPIAKALIDHAFQRAGIAGCERVLLRDRVHDFRAAGDLILGSDTAELHSVF